MNERDIRRQYEAFRNHVREGRQEFAYQRFVECPELVRMLVEDVSEEELSTCYLDIGLEVGAEEALKFKKVLENYKGDTQEFEELAKIGERLDSVERQEVLKESVEAGEWQ
tara:strand:- start:6617 stop:6949 length:333 start_codon:yes stop_codon:yes gene_type:complete